MGAESPSCRGWTGHSAGSVSLPTLYPILTWLSLSFAHPSTDHDYADAQSRGNPTTLLATESTGAISPTFAPSTARRAPGAIDHTRYGESRASPRQFYAHHLAAISCAIVRADAMTIHDAADAMGVELVAPRAAVHA